MKVVMMCLLVLYGCERNCPKTGRVVSVGGCSQSGRCGVKLENGDFALDYFPVVGQEITYYKVCLK